MIADPPLRYVTADIGLPSDEIHAYFITTVYDYEARISRSVGYFMKSSSHRPMIKSRRVQLFTLPSPDALPKLDYVGRLNARLIALYFAV